MRHSWTHIAVSFCLAGLVIRGVPAEEPTKPTAAVNSSATERLLVLDNGKVQRGIISREPTGFMVTRPEGRLVFQAEQVLFDADDLEDAYRQFRRKLPPDSVSGRIDLARWCITNGLRDQANAELRDALKLDPDSQIARNLLSRLHDQLLPTHELPRVRVIENGFSMLGNSRPKPIEESLGGLPKELAVEFASKVQPLLVNRCAIAGCHGPGAASSGFELQRVKLGKPSPRSFSERNLDSVLARLDIEKPQHSPLLVKLRNEAKNFGPRVTHGGLSAAQTETLYQWVINVARHRRRQPPKPRTKLPDQPEADMPPQSKP